MSDKIKYMIESIEHDIRADIENSELRRAFYWGAAAAVKIMTGFDKNNLCDSAPNVFEDMLDKECRDYFRTLRLKK